MTDKLQTLQLRFKENGLERKCSDAFIAQEMNRLMTSRRDFSYGDQDWAFKLHTLAECLNTRAGGVPVYYLWNSAQQKVLPIVSFGTCKI